MTITRKQKLGEKQLYGGFKRLIKDITRENVVIMPRTILPRRNRRCALSATGTRKSEDEKDARGVIYFMEENVIIPRECGEI